MHVEWTTAPPYDLCVIQKQKKIIEQNQKWIKDEEEKKWKQWKNLCIDIQIKHNFRSGINKVKVFLEICQTNSVKYTAEMSALHVCFQLWKEQPLDKRFPFKKEVCLAPFTLPRNQICMLNEGDAYYKLRDFSFLIKSLRTSLRELCDDPNDNILLVFEQLGEKYEEKLKCVT